MQERFASGRFKVSVYICGYCGIRSQGARSRDLHDASHMLIRPGWFKRAVTE